MDLLPKGAGESLLMIAMLMFAVAWLAAITH